MFAKRELNQIKSAKKYGLSDFQLYAVLVCTILGAGITTLPRVTAQYAGRDGWISILFGGVIVWGFSCLIYYLCSRFPDKTLPEFSVQILGKPLGILVTTGYIIYALFLASSALRIFIELVKTWTMLWTPHWVFIVVFLTVVIYTVRLGAITLARLMELVFYMTLPAVLMFLLPLSEFEKMHLLPVGNEGIKSIMSAVPEAGFAFLGFEVLLIFFPLTIHRERIFRVLTLALVTVTLIYAVNTVLTFGVLSVEQTRIQVWPVINYLRIGTSPFVERLDTILLVVWTAQVFGVTAIQYYSVTFSTATLAGKKAHDLWVLVLAPLVLGITMFPRRIVDVFMLSDLVGRWGFVYIAGMVLLLLSVSIIRGQDDRKVKSER